MYRLVSFVIVFLMLGTKALACPLINGELIDFNCNQRFKVAFTGDSITRGIGDRRNRGGFVKRVKQLLNIKTGNLGDPGANSGALLRAFQRNIKKEKTSKRLSNADMMFIMVGTNDYWSDTSPEKVGRNIKRIIKFLTGVFKRRGTEVVPVFVVSTLLPTKRSFQQPYIERLNAALVRMKSKDLPVRLLLHNKFNTSVISGDSLHPSPAGYSKIAKFIAKFIRTKGQVLMAKKRADKDMDGIFDKFEPMFGTDPNLTDTNGNGMPDGVDIFGTM